MDFTRKARFVAGGHVTDPPTSITYSSIVARDSVRLAFLIAALNDLDILSADIGNAYLNAYTKEKDITLPCEEALIALGSSKAEVEEILKDSSNTDSTRIQKIIDQRHH